MTLVLYHRGWGLSRVMGKNCLGKMYKKRNEKMAEFVYFARTGRYLRERPAETKNAPEGTAPRRSFDQYTILNRVVASQSTRLARSIGFLYRVAKP